MSFAPLSVYHGSGDGSILGRFDEKEHGNMFEFSQNNTGMYESEYSHLVWVADGYRYANVLKTVAYVAVDEDADGNFIVEKWQTKNFKKYGG